MESLLLLLLLGTAAATLASGSDLLVPSSTSTACSTVPAAPGKTLVAVVGDSITWGFNCHSWGGGFVKVLQDSLGTAKYDVRDCGHNGLDAVKPKDGEIHHRSYWSSSEFKASMAMNASVVIVMLGTNDADEWCLSQNSSACPGGTSKHFATDLQACARARAPGHPALADVDDACGLDAGVDLRLHEATERQKGLPHDPTTVRHTDKSFEPPVIRSL